MRTTLEIVIRGQVQGLGFRPYVYRLAGALGVLGSVSNSTAGVRILAQGPNSRRLARELEAHPPPLARIASFTVRRTKCRPFNNFEIVTSRRAADSGVEVLPDIATCPDCRREVADPHDRRAGYAFTNCTQCGPRYTIIENLPYDRPRTTMTRFAMCPDCAREYRCPTDRRFHAQPNACPVCGPRLLLLDNRGEAVPGDPVALAAMAIARGKTVAVKSLGGFQLACDALSNRAVATLRRRKNRPFKPLAVMCADLATVRRFCRIDRAGGEMLLSPGAPIVLLARRLRPTLTVSRLVAPGNNRYGVMLAYTPLHLLLLAKVRAIQGTPTVLVMTSANRRDDPITADDEELFAELGGVFDIALTHDRPIANRCDDSVVASGRAPMLVRRARGQAPQSIRLEPVFHVKQPCLAVGAELKDCFTLAQDGRAFPGPHIGSLASARAERFFAATLERYIAWTGIRPRVIACDLHPDYLSTRLAERLSADRQVPLVRVQHHYAHVLSVMAEHGVREPVLGLAFDGTGYGTDGAIWGCEFVGVDEDLGWSRLAHLAYLRLNQAGDATADPAMTAAAYLLQALGRVPPGIRLGPSLGQLDRVAATTRGTWTSSLGRLFDAVAAIIGVRARASFEGEAPAALEAAAEAGERRSYYSADMLDFGRRPALIRTPGIIRAVAEDARVGTAAGVVAARFQNTVVKAAAAMADRLAQERGVRTVVLSGGSFQNDALRIGIVSALGRIGYRTLHNRLVPANDGGISLGQAVAAACPGCDD